MADSTSISFVKEVKIEEKIKKAKGDKKKKKKNAEEMTEAVIDEEMEVENMPVDSTTMAADDVEKKVKITTKYYVIMRSIIQYDDATIEDKTWKYEVKNVKSKADESARLDEEKYQWEFITAKGEPIYLYLNGDNTVSTMEVKDEKYLMRGF